MLAQIQAMFAVVDLGKINWNQFLEKYLEIAMSIIGKVIVSFLIIAIGFKLIKILIKLLKTTLEKAEIDYGVISFSCSFIRIGLRCIVIFMAVAHMGVEVSSFIALLGSAGVAVGLALQGTLSNVAGGVLLLILKPFQVGDYIVLTGTDCEGEVAAMDIFYTKLKTIDNRVIVIPNGTLSNSNLINNTKQERRLIDIEVGISYDADIKEVKRILTDIAKNEKRILDQDGVKIFVSSLADSSVMMGIRCWVSTSDYVATKWALNEEIKIRFDEEGIELSGGESQKLAIARALYEDAGVLILDEPANSLDPIAEAEMYECMFAAGKDRTLILISHRLYSTRKADRICYIENGKIAEEGTHEELMKANGKYAAMYHLQVSLYAKGAAQ